MKILKNPEDIYSGIENFIKSLKKNTTDYSYYPALKGLTNHGKNLELGFSCYALKIEYMLGHIDNINNIQTREWVDYLNSFQKNVKNLPENSYVDNELLEAYLNPDFKTKVKNSLKHSLTSLNIKTYDSNHQKLKKSINAESKQAIATLYQVGHKNNRFLQSDFKEYRDLERYLNTLDWSKPWATGAQYSSFCVYTTTQDLDFRENLIEFIKFKADKETGSYFTKTPKSSREIINGAMKVITGLDWLNHEIHYPKELIDFCIDNKPFLEGCDIVDYVYTLYKCSQQVDYRKKEINLIFSELSESLLDLYYFKEGGFSYFPKKSQSHYYGLKITNSEDTPDIHGTLLCLWALNMILDNLEILSPEKKLIKP
jgi:hypothetical protein